MPIFVILLPRNPSFMTHAGLVSLYWQLVNDEGMSDEISITSDTILEMSEETGLTPEKVVTELNIALSY